MSTLRTILLVIFGILIGILCILVTSFGTVLSLGIEPITAMEFTTIGYSASVMWILTGLLFLGLSTGASLIFTNSWGDNPTLKDVGLYLVCIGGCAVVILLFLPVTDFFLTIAGSISTLVALIGCILMMIDKIRSKRMSKLAQ